MSDMYQISKFIDPIRLLGCIRGSLGTSVLVQKLCRNIYRTGQPQLSLFIPEYTIV